MAQVDWINTAMDVVLIVTYSWVSMHGLLVSIKYLDKAKSKEYFILFGLIFLTAVLAANHYIYRYTHIFFSHPEYSFINDTINLCYGPLILMYAERIRRGKVANSYWLLFLPVILHMSYFLLSNYQ